MLVPVLTPSRRNITAHYASLPLTLPHRTPSPPRVTWADATTTTTATAIDSSRSSLGSRPRRKDGSEVEMAAAGCLVGVLGGAARHRAHVVVTEELASLWQATVSGGQRGLQPYGPDVAPYPRRAGGCLAAVPVAAAAPRPAFARSTTARAGAHEQQGMRVPQPQAAEAQEAAAQEEAKRAKTLSVLRSQLSCNRANPCLPAWHCPDPPPRDMDHRMQGTEFFLFVLWAGMTWYISSTAAGLPPSAGSLNALGLLPLAPAMQACHAASNMSRILVCMTNGPQPFEDRWKRRL
eukprot:XP_001701504.1 predicted protein [Chlamydomonas reinhardtii]